MHKRSSPIGQDSSRRPPKGKKAAVALLLCMAMLGQGCFDPVYPQRDREERIVEALGIMEGRPVPPSPLTPARAVAYALQNNLDAKAAEIETAYFNESAIAARRRLLPALNLRYSLDHSNHPDARYFADANTGEQTLPSSYNADPNYRQGEIGLMWNVLDFGVGYLRARQEGEKIRQSTENYRRVRQQVALDVLSHYWRTSAALTVAKEAETLRRELEEQTGKVREAVGLGMLGNAEGARRELALHAGLADLDQWSRVATQARLDLGRVLGCGNALDLVVADFPETTPELPPLPNGDASALQTAALQRRPELFQQDSKERIAADEARLALLQMAPNASLSLNLYDNPDKFLEWNNWMTVGARVSWNIFNIPARMAEKRAANLQGETARKKGIALAAAIMAQVGIAFCEWKLSYENADGLSRRAAARARLVDALAEGEAGGQTKPGEVLEERVRLLAERAAALHAMAEARVAGARLANAIGLDVDNEGRLLWKLGGENPVDLLAEKVDEKNLTRIQRDERHAPGLLPQTVGGLRVVLAEDFESPAEYFLEQAEVPAKKADKPAEKAVAKADDKKSADLSALAPPDSFKDMKDVSVLPLNEIAQIDNWSRRDGGEFMPPPLSPSAFGEPHLADQVGPVKSAKTETARKAVPAAVPAPAQGKAKTEPGRGVDKTEGKANPADRMMRGDDMRRMYAERNAEAARRAGAAEGRNLPGGIPPLTASEFVDPETRKLMDPQAWRTLGEDEIQALSKTGLTSPNSLEWDAPGVRHMPVERNTGPSFAPSGIGGESWGTVAPGMSVSGAKLVPPEGGVSSLRPPGADGAAVKPARSFALPSEASELENALAPLEIISLDAPAAVPAPSAPPVPAKAKSLRPPGA